jgi:hypothetical protein
VLTGTLKQARRAAIAVAGFTILAIGVAMLVTPGPGWLVISVGLSLLGLEFVWARRLLKRFKDAGRGLGNAISRKQATEEEREPAADTARASHSEPRTGRADGCRDGQ